MSLILWGASRLGKTVWARSLGKHLYFPLLYSGEEAMRMTDPDVKYAIFDDIAGGLKFFHTYKGWFGGQNEIMVKKLFHDPKTMTWNRPVIWISNEHPLTEFSQSEVDWFLANAVVVEVTENFLKFKEESRDNITDEVIELEEEEDSLFVAE